MKRDEGGRERESVCERECVCMCVCVCVCERERERGIVVAASLIIPVLVHKLKKFVDSNATKKCLSHSNIKTLPFLNLMRLPSLTRAKFVRLVGFEP